jgi:hypothetical protein
MYDYASLTAAILKKIFSEIVQVTKIYSVIKQLLDCCKMTLLLLAWTSAAHCRWSPLSHFP